MTGTHSNTDRDRRFRGAAPYVAYGDDAVLRIPAHIQRLGATRALLVCGRRSFEASGADRMLPALRDVADVRRWSDFAPNTDAADLVNGLTVARAFAPDLVLGIGGGSAMDMAKLLATFGEVAGDGVLDTIRGGYRTEERKPHLVLAPTTSGSGAEATHFAVVYIGDEKYSIGGEGMRPDVIVLDPSLSRTGSAYQRATSGIDAVTQAIESLWAVAATDDSRRFARIALRLLMPAIEPFVASADPDSARAMTLGSHFAGRAIDVSRTTAAHALSYGITKTYGISHGHAVAITLGAFLEAHADAGADSLRAGVDPAVHAAAMADVLTVLEAADGAEARGRFTDLMKRLGLDPSLAAAGATSLESRQALAASVNAERLGNNPVRYSQGDLGMLMERIT